MCRAFFSCVYRCHSASDVRKQDPEVCVCVSAARVRRVFVLRSDRCDQCTYPAEVDCEGTSMIIRSTDRTAWSPPIAESTFRRRFLVSGAGQVMARLDPG